MKMKKKKTELLSLDGEDSDFLFLLSCRQKSAVQNPLFEQIDYVVAIPSDLSILTYIWILTCQTN